MKLFSTAVFAATIAAIVIALNLLQPVTAATGSSVIYTPRTASTPATTVLLPATLTKLQADLLRFAYDVAVRDGHKYPQYVQGVLMQESKAGGMQSFRVAGLENKVGDRYFGVCQIKLAAAKDVMKSYPALWSKLSTRTDEELSAMLIMDNKFNIEVCSKYLLMMGINKDPARGIAAFNQGPGGVNNIEVPSEFKYTKGVIGHSQKIAAINYKPKTKS